MSGWASQKAALPGEILRFHSSSFFSRLFEHIMYFQSPHYSLSARSVSNLFRRKLWNSSRENQFCFCFTLRKLISKWQLTTSKENASEDLGQVDQERGLSCSKHLMDVSIMVTMSVVTNKYGKLAINGGMFICFVASDRNECFYFWRCMHIMERNNNRTALL